MKPSRARSAYRDVYKRQGPFDVGRIVLQPALAGAAAGGDGRQRLVDLVSDRGGQLAQAVDARHARQLRARFECRVLGRRPLERQVGGHADGGNADERIDQPQFTQHAAVGREVQAEQRQCRARHRDDRDATSRQEAQRRQDHGHVEHRHGDFQAGEGIRQEYHGHQRHQQRDARAGTLLQIPGRLEEHGTATPLNGRRRLAPMAARREMPL